jgi:hypothetical protein
MTLLSADFDQKEFEKDSPLPAECVESYTNLCKLILQPIRDHLAVSMVVTSGYRPAYINKIDHGVKNSEHVATADYCAADWEVPALGKDLRAVFDWIRNQPSEALPFHQVILEHGNFGDIIHISWNKTTTARQALEGSTFNASPYKAWSVV